MMKEAAATQGDATVLSRSEVTAAAEAQWVDGLPSQSQASEKAMLHFAGTGESAAVAEIQGRIAAAKDEVLAADTNGNELLDADEWEGLSADATALFELGRTTADYSTDTATELAIARARGMASLTDDEVAAFHSLVVGIHQALDEGTVPQLSGPMPRYNPVNGTYLGASGETLEPITLRVGWGSGTVALINRSTREAQVWMGGMGRTDRGFGPIALPEDATLPRQDLTRTDRVILMHDALGIPPSQAEHRRAAEGMFQDS
jgi:hypothetical protein